MRILKHDAKRVSQCIFLYLSHINSIVNHRSSLHIIKAVDQVGDRGFSGSGRSDKSNFLSRFCIQADILQDHMLFRITKINIFKTDITAKHCQFSLF